MPQVWPRKGKRTQITNVGSSHCGAAEMDPASILEDVGSVPGLAQWVDKDLVLP